MRTKKRPVTGPIRYLFIVKSPEYESKYASLSGTGIRLRDAATKYGLHRSTLWRWCRIYNLIPMINEYPIELDESYVAYCAGIYLRDGYRTSGSKLFDEIGRPKHSAND
jgi:hypothetical protein